MDLVTISNNKPLIIVYLSDTLANFTRFNSAFRQQITKQIVILRK